MDASNLSINTTTYTNHIDNQYDENSNNQIIIKSENEVFNISHNDGLIEGIIIPINGGCSSTLSAQLTTVKNEVLYSYNANTHMINTLLEVLVTGVTHRRLLILWDPVDF